MKVVILAAGQGSRLGRKHQPKALTLLANDKSILQHQLEAVSRFLSLDDVIVVVGYLKEMIIDQFPNLLYVYNSLYKEENTSKSLLRALKKCDEDVLWLNGDVVFDPRLLEQIVKHPRTAMVVNKGVVAEEEVKYRTDGSGCIVEVSKKVADPEGEALGINVVLARDLPLLKRGLEHCEPQDYFEKGIEWSIQQGLSVGTVVVDQSSCTEVDFPDDLKRANTLLAGW